MSAQRTCVTCPEPALPGRIMCALCKAHAAELEHVRLGLAPTPRPVITAVKSFAVASIGLALACSGSHRVPCDAHDRAAQLDLAAARVKCTARIEACETLECVDVEEAACNAAAEKRCAE